MYLHSTLMKAVRLINMLLMSLLLAACTLEVSWLPAQWKSCDHLYLRPCLPCPRLLGPFLSHRHPCHAVGNCSILLVLQRANHHGYKF